MFGWRGGSATVISSISLTLHLGCKGVVLEEMHAGRPKAYEILGSHSGIAEDASLVGCHTVAIISKVSKDGVAF